MTLIIDLRLPRSAPRLWQLRLMQRLATGGDRLVRMIWTEQKAPTESCVELLFALERMIFGASGPTLASTIPPEDFPRVSGEPEGQADLTLDFCGVGGEEAGTIWNVTFDGEFGDFGVLGALLAGNFPVIEISDAVSGRLVASGRAGSESAKGLLGDFESVLSRAVALIVAAIEGRASSPSLGRERVFRRGCAATARFQLLSMARAVRHRLYNLCCYAPHWRVGWRFVDGPDVIDLGRHPESGWTNLPDDVVHFYADPFPFEWKDRMFLFVEDFDHRLGRGVISVVEFDERGPRHAPRPVLDIEVHLSYPFVFEHAGEIWMIPESLGRRSIDLYRAETFPGRWSLESTLVADIAASDATLLKQGGEWWMMATVQEDPLGSWSDALYLWRAPTPLGPWIAHKGNPVLVDIASARPAGRVVRRGGRLVRPVQDCRGGYGAALALATITRLDEDAFEQRIDARICPGPLWPGRRLHTLNRAGRLECIDGSANAFKLQRGLRWLDRAREGRDAQLGDAAALG